MKRSRGSDNPAAVASRVERLLERCAAWVLHERHRKVLVEIEKVLPSVAGQPELEAQLLLWKAHALLATGTAERALTAASRSWELDDSPHACYLAAEAFIQLGENGKAENLLRTGCAAFPEAPHLSLALAMLLADEGRMPEALQVVESAATPADAPPQAEVFQAGLHANLLASMGRWDEAMAVLDESLDHHPGSELLSETQKDLKRHLRRAGATQRLAASWGRELEASPSPQPEVEEEIHRLASSFESGPLLPRAACRLFRAFAASTGVRPRNPAVWALALLLTVLELDGQTPATAPFARAACVAPSSVRPVRRRLDEFLDSMESGLVRRSFGCSSNPRLDETPGPAAPGPGRVVDFPRRDRGGSP